MRADRNAVCIGQFLIKRVQMGADGEFGEMRHGTDDFRKIGKSRQIAFDNGANQQIPEPAHCPGKRITVVEFPFQQGWQIGAVKR